MREGRQEQEKIQNREALRSPSRSVEKYAVDNFILQLYYQYKS